MWEAGPPGVPRRPWLAVRPGASPRRDAWPIVVVLTMGHRLRGQLGQAGAPGPARGRALSPHPPDGAGDVPHALGPERRGVAARVDTLWGTGSGGLLSPRQGQGPAGGLHHGAPPAGPQGAVPPAPASPRHPGRRRGVGRTLGAGACLPLGAAAPQGAVALAEDVAPAAQDRGHLPMGRWVWPAVSHRFGAHRAKGPRPRAVSERGALCGPRRGAPAALGQAPGAL